MKHRRHEKEQRRRGAGMGAGAGGGPARAGGVMLYGVHAVTAAWCNPKRVVLRLSATQSGLKQIEGALRKARQMGLKRPDAEMADAHTIEKTLPPGAVHQGVAAAVESLPDVELEDVLESAEKQAFIAVLDQVTDPHNVGAILRSAAALGAIAVAVTERHASATTGTLAKAASGALDTLPLVRLANLSQALDKMKKAGFWCIGLDESGENALHDVKLPDRVALVLGAEGEGMRRLTRECCDEIARLPTRPPIGSLNVSNAAAVAMYEIHMQIAQKLK